MIERTRLHIVRTISRIRAAYCFTRCQKRISGVKPGAAMSPSDVGI
ncbi:hypothetical protein [Paenibacillus polymyxa]|nr:hypothetical protein [Paenibacillus polymyxa]